MNVRLLVQVRSAGGGYIPWAELGAEASAVAADLEALEQFGFRFERHPYLGVAYRGPATRLCPDQIEWELGTQHVGRRIAVWNRVGSTNDIAARAAASAANAGLVVMAEEQTAGRGRRGRSWTAPTSSSLLLSALVFPPPPLADAAWLTALGAVAVAETVEAVAGSPARIKWPNDVRVGGRKIAGILVERGQGAVIGLGLNVNTEHADFPEILRDSATSLAIVTGGPHDRSEVARTVIRRLDHHYTLGLRDGPEPLAEAWRARLEWLGERVRVESASAGAVEGRLVDADLRRGLTVETPARLVVVVSSDVLSLAVLGGDSTRN